MNKRILTWGECKKKAQELAETIITVNIEKGGSPIKLYGVPRGGIPVALMLEKIICKRGFECSIVENPEDATFIVDDIVDSGRTLQKYAENYRQALIFPLYIANEGEWLVFPWEKGVEDNGPEENVVRLMQYIGEDVNREGLVETPSRVIKSYSKLFGGYRENAESIMKTFSEGACDEMVVLKNIELYSTCEHHMLPFFGKCHIAYIPNGKVIGVSKLARLMEVFARRMQIQERIGQQITEALEKYLQPLGAACIIEAQHFCMTSRGVEKQKSIMVTSSLTGVFKENREARAELMSLIKD